MASDGYESPWESLRDHVTVSRSGRTVVVAADDEIPTSLCKNKLDRSVHLAPTANVSPKNVASKRTKPTVPPSFNPSRAAERESATFSYGIGIEQHDKLL